MPAIGAGRPKSSLDDPEQAAHNLEHSENTRAIDSTSPPVRDVSEADFAAEAHGFSGFEAVAKGSEYRGNAPCDGSRFSWWNRVKAGFAKLRNGFNS